MSAGEAPGKIVLFGEHSVVYDQPAIAAPVFGVKAHVWLEPSDHFGIVLKNPVDKDKACKAIEYTVDNTLSMLGLDDKNFRLTVDSQVPIASGMGSGAAVGVAVVRAVAKHFKRGLSDDEVSSIDYKTEQMLHTHPSGIDNTVISHGRPIFFLKGRMEPISIGKPMEILIASTGIRSSTKNALEQVHRAWEKDRAEYDGFFREAGAIANDARKAIEEGELEKVGALMADFQQFYRNIKMSHEENEKLIKAALGAGALGSKISGAGLGGCVIALVDGKCKGQVRETWEKLEPELVIETTIA
jgi:mevalonate kinase